MTEYASTRDLNQKTISYEETVLGGLAPDGGLYVPYQIPQLTTEELRQLLKMEYSELAARVKKFFAGDSLSINTLRDMTAKAYSKEIFPEQAGGIVTPVRKLVGTDICLQNLSLGPTAAFKDMAMQLLAQEMEYFLNLRGRYLDILGATSGDTGSAAEAALKNLSRVRIAILSPLIGMSDFQRAQMGNLTGDGVTNISVDGRFDDCQDLVKEVMASEEFHRLGAVNSINWARISAQIAYYFAGYAQSANKFGDSVDFVVPSGNFGNALAGHYARAMGLPIRNIIIATNENDVLHRFFQEGIYQEKSAIVTSSPSMDISKASNLERLIYILLGNDPLKTRQFMEQFSRSEAARLGDYGIPDNHLQTTGFNSGVSSHAKRIETMKWAASNGGGVIDPHTADALHVARQLPDDGVIKICLETALAVKFSPTLEKAGLEIPLLQHQRFAYLLNQPDVEAGFRKIAVDAEALKEILRQIFTMRT